MIPRVLIVDDSQPMRELLRMMLTDVAIVVGECDDGSDALELYTRLQPDWVLMDFDMKDMDGIAAARQIITADPKAQIMIVTDYDDSELSLAALQAGCKRYVVKEDLVSILEILST